MTNSIFPSHIFVVLQSAFAIETVESIVTQILSKISDLLRSSEDLDHFRVTGDGIFSFPKFFATDKKVPRNRTNFASLILLIEDKIADNSIFTLSLIGWYCPIQIGISSPIPTRHEISFPSTQSAPVPFPSVCIRFQSSISSNSTCLR